MNAYQWTVLFAAWLGWGFDIFDSLLFNYVAPNAVPVLLGLPLGSPAARTATLQWTGILTSLLLVGWAVGGIIFGRVADRLGRTRTLLLTMLMYALGTAACAFAPNMAVLVFFRIVASLGIGGEWAAGAAMVAEVVPEHRRVEAGALLYTAAPMGLFLATIVTYQVQGVYFAGSPEVAWRYVFLFGLLPAAIAFLVRLFVKEPERWKKAASHAAPPRLAELFTPQYRAITISGLLMAVVALITWWSCNAFISVVATGLASEAAAGLPPAQATALIESWKQTAGNWFNIGGLIGTLLTVPASKMLGRRTMFSIISRIGLSVLAAFGLPMNRAHVCLCTSRSGSRCSGCSARSPTTCQSCIRRACAALALASATTPDDSSRLPGRSSSARSPRAARALWVALSRCCSMSGLCRSQGCW
jgi:MFS family permease